MLNHPTLDQLKTLKLDGMAEAFGELETQDGTVSLGHAEWLGLLVDRETSSRATKRFESRMRTAKLRHVGAAPEDVDYRARRGLDKALFQQLLTGKMDTRQTQPDDHRPLWCRQNLAGLCPGTSRLPGRRYGSIQTPAQTVRRGWSWHMATGASPASSKASQKPVCSSLMTGVRIA